jgi:hypothetical protein
MTPTPTSLHPGWQSRKTRGQRVGSSGGVGVGKCGAAEFLYPLRMMPVVYGGVNVLVSTEEALVVWFEAAAGGIEGLGRWPWCTGGAGVPRQWQGLWLQGIQRPRPPVKRRL